MAQRGIEPLETLAQIVHQIARDSSREREVQQHADAAQDLGAQRDQRVEGRVLVVDGQKLPC